MCCSNFKCKTVPVIQWPNCTSVALCLAQRFIFFSTLNFHFPFHLFFFFAFQSQCKAKLKMIFIRLAYEMLCFVYNLEWISNQLFSCFPFSCFQLCYCLSMAAFIKFYAVCCPSNRRQKLCSQRKTLFRFEKKNKIIRFLTGREREREGGRDEKDRKNNCITVFCCEGEWNKRRTKY